MLDAIVNCERVSGIEAVRFPETGSELRILENMLSISVLELLVTLVCCIMCGRNI